MTPHDRRGFTLIELLIVVVIIGILAAIAIPKFSSTREKAFRASMMSDLRNLTQLQTIYHTDALTFADDPADLNAVITEGVTVTITESTNTGWAATATHTSLPGKQCGMFDGTADPSNAVPATSANQVKCNF